MTRDVCHDCVQVRATLYLDIASESLVCAHRIPQEVCS